MIILIIAIIVIVIIVFMCLENKNVRKQFNPTNQIFKKAVLPFKRDETFHGIVSIRSQAIHNNNGREYNVDLLQVTCTCANFEKRDQFETISPMRYCRHLLRLLNERNAFKSMGKWEKAIINDGSGAPIQSWVVSLKTAPEVLIVDAGSGNEWVDVYAHTKRSGEHIADASGEIQRFGWNYIEHRWSYGEGPPGSRELTPLMKSVTKKAL
jgi:hypothetical protein